MLFIAPRSLEPGPMTARFLIVSLVFSACTCARASFVTSFTNGVAIPDNSATGYQDSRVVSGLPSVITDVNVSLELSDGFNGDLYAWLSHNGALTILLNRA